MRTLIYISLFAIISNFSIAKTTFSGERLKSSAINYLRDALGEDAEISLAQKIDEQTFAEDKVQAEFTSEKNTLRGSCNLNVEFKLDGKLLRHISIPIKVRIYKNIPIAATGLSANSKIKNEDIIIQRYDVTDYSESELIDKSLIIGKSLDKYIAKGRPITKSSISKEFVVKRGSLVNLIVNSGAIQINAQGRAQNSGKAGEEIKVIRDGSGGLIQGIADQNGSVIIGAGK